MAEFEIIARFFSPLAGTGSFQLTDDIALISDGVVSKDMLIEGVHFRKNDPLHLVAQKALRVNVSDIIAKGCKPRDYMLGIAWRADSDEADIKDFCEGLQIAQDAYGLMLLGGDTTRQKENSAPMVISVTITGTPCRGAPILRSGASLGDVLYVTGTIGDGGLGLWALEEGRDCPSIAAYHLPNPPADLARAIAKNASAALDISDGLLADAEHLAKASKLSAHIDASRVPLSTQGHQYTAELGEEGLVRLLSCGDDYQVLCAVPLKNCAGFEMDAALTGGKLTRMGVCKAANTEHVIVLREDASKIDISRKGYEHF